MPHGKVRPLLTIAFNRAIIFIVIGAEGGDPFVREARRKEHAGVLVPISGKHPSAAKINK